jgi:hypothetical protein
VKRNIWHECLRYAIYYAPRGRERLLMLGESIGQRYLAVSDRLVGVMGEAGVGKSSIVKGMFPGLELTNDDEGVNVRPAPLVQMHRDGKFRAKTFHVDARFESAFLQAHEITEAVRAALEDGRRVIVEHFELVYDLLKLNANLIVGVGEEIVVARPDVFGPYPADIWSAIEGTAIYRRMAHSAEDITSLVLERDYGYERPELHSDVPRGFVIDLEEKPENLALEELERKVREIIDQDLPIFMPDDSHISFGGLVHECGGPRIHVKRTSEIKNFRIAKELYYDELTDAYGIVGLVGEPRRSHFVSRHPRDPQVDECPPCADGASSP